MLFLLFVFVQVIDLFIVIAYTTPIQPLIKNGVSRKINKLIN